MDLYRLKDEKEAIHAGVEDCLYSVIPVWWNGLKKAPGIFPGNTLHITITLVNDNTSGKISIHGT